MSIRRKAGSRTLPLSGAQWSTLFLCGGEAGDEASGEGEQAAGLEKDGRFPWQPWLARHQGSSANSPGIIPMDLEAGIPGS